jgi:hypothetical protein
MIREKVKRLMSVRRRIIEAHAERLLKRLAQRATLESQQQSATDETVGVSSFSPKNSDEHFGQRVIAAIEALPAEMRNDPAYADPVA